jgi:hypothetical protein
MGVLRFGMPEQEVLFLQHKLGLKVFVEGGTYTGGTAVKASKIFASVFTIEKSEQMYEIAKKNLAGIENITLLRGDTRFHIDTISSQNDSLLYWLDAHWSGEDTYGAQDECPLVDELGAIFKYCRKCAILIDDARLFLAPPPKPHVFGNWPTLTDIVKVMPDGWELIEYEDVIYLIPEEIKLEFRAFLQEDVTRKWLMSSKKKSLIQRALRKLGLKCSG